MERIAALAGAAPRRVIGAAVLLTLLAALISLTAGDRFSVDGFQDPGAESSRAAQVLADRFDQPGMQVVFVVTAADGDVLRGEARAVGTGIATALQQSGDVSGVSSVWSAPPGAAGNLMSDDGASGLVVAGLRGTDEDAQGAAAELADALSGDLGAVTVRAGGSALAAAQITEQTARDLVWIEAVAVPVSFLALVWVFGGVWAAALPVLVGMVSVAGSTAALKVAAQWTEISSLALNISVALALALAIDYTLLMLSRFRDEMRHGCDRGAAMTRTMRTAGRTVLFSALIVAPSMLTLLVFPMPLLRSFAYAGVGAVGFAALAAVTIAPAAITLLGVRLDAFDLRRPMRRLLRRPERLAAAPERSAWYRGIRFVMRHSLPVAVGVIALLLAVGSPFLHANWGFPDDRVLPESASARQVGDILREEFRVDPSTDVTIVVPDAADVAPAQYADYAATLSRVTDVASVSSHVGTFVDGARSASVGGPAGADERGAFLTVRTTAGPFTALGERQLSQLRAVEGPGGNQVQFTGIGQINRDTAAAVTARLPVVLGIVTVVTLMLLFVLTGSVVLPVKAVLCNLLALTATFGALVWIFQDGNLGGLGTTPTGSVIAVVPVLLFCITFGLSMDYEVFLLARIREVWMASDRSAGDNDEAVALGIAHTGRVVTAAAVLMAISFVALTAADVSIIRMCGLGLTLAVLMDATLIRMLLVPAVMHALGRWNWWAPARLAAWHRRLTGGAPRVPVAAAD